MNLTLEFPGVRKQQYVTGRRDCEIERDTYYILSKQHSSYNDKKGFPNYSHSRWTNIPAHLALEKKKERCYWRIFFRADPVASYEDWVRTQAQDLSINSIYLAALARDSATLCSVTWPILPILLTGEILFAIYFQFWCFLGIQLQVSLQTIWLQFLLQGLLDASPKHYAHGKRDYVSIVTATLRCSKLPLVTRIRCLLASRHQCLLSCRRKDPGP